MRREVKYGTALFVNSCAYLLFAFVRFIYYDVKQLLTLWPQTDICIH